MAEDLELLRLRAKAKLKLRQQATKPAQDTTMVTPPQEEESWAAQAARALAPLSMAASETPQPPPREINTTQRPSSFADFSTTRQDPSVGLAPALDAVTLPTRALAKTRGMEMSDPTAYLFRPEAEQAAKNVEAQNAANPWDGRAPTSFADFGKNATPVIAEVGLGMASDPLTFAAPGISAATKAGPKVAEAVGKGLEAVGESQMRRVIKPLIRHERKTQKPIEEIIFEYGLDKGDGGASPKAIYEKSSQKLNQLGGQLKAQIQQGKDQGARVNTDKIINQAMQDFLATKGESPDFYSIAPDIEEIASDFRNRARQANAKGFGDLDLLQAQNFKQYIGHEGAWQHIAKAKGLPVGSKETARAQFAEDLYHRLNDAIDEASPEGIREINRQLSEIIPVQQSAGWRQVVEGRQNNISLTDVVGMTATAVNPKVWPLLVLNRMSKSGDVASKIYRLGEKLRTAKTPAEELRYTKALEKIGLSKEEIEATKNIVRGSSGDDVFNRQELVVATPRSSAQVPTQEPTRPLPVVTNAPQATPETKLGGLEWQVAGYRRRQAEKYLQATLKREPTQEELKSFMAANAENEIPKPPVQEKATREFKGRRSARELDAMDNLLRNGDPEWATVQTPINKAPETFTIGGMELKRTKGQWDNQIAYKDKQGRIRTFRGDETIHMDAPKQAETPSQAAPSQVKDDFIGEDGEPLFQMAENAGIPSGRESDPKVVSAAAKAWKEKGVDSPFFKKWFGDSKVVDEQGKPLVVYHGTLGNFDAFEENQRGVFFFSPSKEWVVKFSKSEDGAISEGGNVMPVYLKVSNPFDFENKKHVSALAAEASLGSLAISQIKKGIWDRLEDRTTMAAIKRLGFDGLYVKEEGNKNIAVFSPQQIKSATGNRGTFDSKNPSILYQSEKLFSPKGQIVRRDGRSTITLFKGKADASTTLHEHAHWVRTNSLNQEESEKLLRIIGKSKWDRDAEEEFAKGFERYLFRGEAPVKGLNKSFETMKQSMKRVYLNGEMDGDLSPGLKEVYDAIFIRNKKVSKRAENMLLKMATSNKTQQAALMSALTKELNKEE